MKYHDIINLNLKFQGKMSSSTVLYLLITILCLLHEATALRCKAGYPVLGKFTSPNLPDTDCSLPWFANRCYVMYTDFTRNEYDAWTYGCILKSQADFCDKSFSRYAVTNNYCCCKTNLCNTKKFAEYSTRCNWSDK